jgi:hypothetical protein
MARLVVGSGAKQIMAALLDQWDPNSIRVRHYWMKRLVWGRAVQVQKQRGAELASGMTRMGRALRLLGVGGAIALGLSQPLQAQPQAQSIAQTAQASLTPVTEPLDLELVEQEQEDLATLTPGACTVNGVITSKTICQNSITIPSLWWLEEQYRQLNGKLVNTWLAYPNAIGTSRRVDLVVNQQVWSLLDYLERYKFIDWFGTTARDYGFSTRVFNSQGRMLAAYTCAAQPTSSTAGSPPKCSLLVNTLGRSGLGRPVQSAP